MLVSTIDAGCAWTMPPTSARAVKLAVNHRFVGVFSTLFLSSFWPLKSANTISLGLVKSRPLSSLPAAYHMAAPARAHMAGGLFELARFAGSDKTARLLANAASAWRFCVLVLDMACHGFAILPGDSLNLELLNRFDGLSRYLTRPFQGVNAAIN
jgi:hypothetical protein